MCCAYFAFWQALFDFLISLFYHFRAFSFKIDENVQCQRVQGKSCNIQKGNLGQPSFIINTKCPLWLGLLDSQRARFIYLKKNKNQKTLPSSEKEELESVAFSRGYLLVSFSFTLIQPKGIWGNHNWAIAFVRLACGHVYRIFSWLLIHKGASCPQWEVLSQASSPGL